MYLTYLAKRFVKYEVTHALLGKIANSPIGTRVHSKTDECSRCTTILVKRHLVGESLGEVRDPEAFCSLCPNPNKNLFHVGDFPSLVGIDFVQGSVVNCE